MTDKEMKEKTKLDKTEKFRLLTNIFMIIFSLVVSILEKDITWIIVALLWSNIAIQELLSSKIIKQQDLLIEMQDKFIKKLLEVEWKIINIKNIKIPEHFSKPHKNKMKERWNYIRENKKFKVPIVVDSNNNLKDGYTSYLIAKELKLKEVEVKVVD